MTKPSKLLLCGVALAVVIAVAGYFVARNQTQQWQAATAARGEIDRRDKECAESWVKNHQRKEGIDPDVDAAFADLEGEAACATDAGKLAREKADERGNAAIESAMKVGYWTSRLALGAFTVLALPWFWYFLLRRIAELRGAILGKPPTL